MTPGYLKVLLSTGEYHKETLIRSSCVNGAICTDAVDGYTCACVAGYSGTQCETGDSLGLSNTYTSIL